uniref:PNN-interacting serine/arginine-rich protein n=1 Tax=Micrurus lemniscatus lemniscatus TaxID=129467 RepID=A0A2D4IIV2_MICLE
MWDQGGQPWQQWPLNQQQWMQSFQHQQDPSQIDWAALAQAWIAQREASGQQNVVEQQGMIPNGQEMTGMEPGPNNHANFQNDPNFNRMWQPEWNMPHQPPHPPPDQPWIPPAPGSMDIVPPSEDSNSQDSGEFAPDNRHIFNQNNHNFGGPPPDNFSMGPVNQFDYQHGTTFGPPQGGFHPPYWQPGPPGPPGPPAPPAPPQNRRERPAFRDRQRSPITLPVKQEPPQIDAVKRRTLPAWIREGLEKMEREKQKKLEKERMEQQRSQLSKKEKKEITEPGEEDGPRLPQKSKFDSDEEEDFDNVEAISSGKVTRSPSPTAHEEQSEPEMTEEEKDYQMMLLTKTLLTEILLDVTNEEIYYVAKDVHRKAIKGMFRLLIGSLIVIVHVL